MRGGASAEARLVAAVREIEARQAISELHARYCFVQDRGHEAHTEENVRAFLDLCAADIVWDNSADGSRAHRGHAAVAAYLRRLWSRFESCRHFCANLLVAFESETRARGRSSFAAVGDVEGEAFVATGYYEDEYVRTDDGWKFLVHRELPYFFVGRDESWAGAKPRIMERWLRGGR